MSCQHGDHFDYDEKAGQGEQEGSEDRIRAGLVPVLVNAAGQRHHKHQVWGDHIPYVSIKEKNIQNEPESQLQSQHTQGHHG